MLDIKKRLQDEITQLDYELKVTLPKEILRAREHGDLRENAEYKTAKERQSFLQARVAQLHRRLAALSLVNLDRIPRGKVGLGSVVTVKQEDTGDEIVYEIVVTEDADPTIGRISPSLADRQVPARPRGGRHRRGEGPLGHEDLRDHEARDDARPGEGRVAAARRALARRSRTSSLAPGLAAALERRPGLRPAWASCSRADGRNLVLGTAVEPAALGGRRTSASGRSPRPGKRPRTNLAGIAAAIALRRDAGPFHQRLVYERLMAPLVPARPARDLKPPAFLQLDPDERFPRADGVGDARSRGARPALPVRPLPRPPRGREGARRRAAALPRCGPASCASSRPRPRARPRLPLRAGALVRRALPLRASARRSTGRSRRSVAAWLADPLRSRATRPAAVPATVGAALSARAL